MNLLTPSAEAFTAAYTDMCARIVALYNESGSPPPPLLHVCGGEAKPCDYIRAVANATGQAYTTTLDAGIKKGGCVGHRSAAQQAALAGRLAPIIARAAGWATSGG